MNITDYKGFIASAEVALDRLEDAQAELDDWTRWSAVPTKVSAILAELRDEIDGAKRELADMLEDDTGRSEWDELRARFPRELCAGDL